MLSQITAKSRLTMKKAKTSAEVSRPSSPSGIVRSGQITDHLPSIWLITPMQLQGCPPSNGQTSSPRRPRRWRHPAEQRGVMNHPVGAAGSSGQVQNCPKYPRRARFRLHPSKTTAARLKRTAFSDSRPASATAGTSVRPRDVRRCSDKYRINYETEARREHQPKRLCCPESDAASAASAQTDPRTMKPSSHFLSIKTRKILVLVTAGALPL